MLKHKSKILFSIFLIIILLSSVCFATDVTTTSENQATQETTQTTQTDSSAELINHDLYLFDNDIVIDGIIDGNVFAFGKNVTVKGEVGGELFVFATNLTIDGGNVYSSLFAFAENIKINGIVYDAYVASKDFNLGSEGYVYRDLKLMSINTNIEGKIRRNADIYSNNIKFADETGTYIGGDLNYSANNELSIPESAVLGDVHFSKIEAKDTNETTVSKIVSKVLDLLKLLVSTLILSLLAIWLTPKFVEKVTNMKVTNMLLAIAIGLGALIGIPFVAILFMITVVGIPTSLAFLAIYFLILAFAKSFASIVIGGFIAKKLKFQGKVKLVALTLASAVVIWALTLIPFIGGLISFITVLLGLGTVVYSLFRKVPEKVAETNE